MTGGETRQGAPFDKLRTGTFRKTGSEALFVMVSLSNHPYRAAPRSGSGRQREILSVGCLLQALFFPKPEARFLNPCFFLPHCHWPLVTGHQSLQRSCLLSVTVFVEPLTYPERATFSRWNQSWLFGCPLRCRPSCYTPSSCALHCRMGYVHTCS